jgi:hypothetical protein
MTSRPRGAATTPARIIHAAVLLDISATGVIVAADGTVIAPDTVVTTPVAARARRTRNARRRADHRHGAHAPQRVDVRRWRDPRGRGGRQGDRHQGREPGPAITHVVEGAAGAAGVDDAVIATASVADNALACVGRSADSHQLRAHTSQRRNLCDPPLEGDLVVDVMLTCLHHIAYAWQPMLDYARS